MAGALLGVVAVASFAGLWIGLGALGVAVFPRLVMAVCLPPALMAGALGVYILVARTNGTLPNEEADSTDA